MLDNSLVKAYAGNKVFKRGREVYQLDLVGDLSIENDNGIIVVIAMVSSEDRTTEHEVRATLSQDNNWILDCQCTCPDFENTSMTCKHAVAVLLKYIDYLNSPVEEEVVVEVPKKPSDEGMKNLLEQYTVHKTAGHELAQPIHIYPFITGWDMKTATVTVEFKIGNTEDRMYSLNDLSRFCTNIEQNRKESYGKYLSFTHSYSAFCAEDKLLLDYLLKLHRRDDMFVEANVPAYYAFGYDESPYALKKELKLRGTYLDQLFDAVGTEPFFMQDDPQEYHIEDEEYNFSTKLEKAEDGYSLSMDQPIFFDGSASIYVPDPKNHRLIRTQRNENVIPLLRYFQSINRNSSFIADEDLPAFAKYMYPVLKQNMILENDGVFVPEDYVIEKPTFKIYLDKPESDLITGELFAVYGEREYNVLTDSENQGRRDLEEEHKIDMVMVSWFNSFDQERQQLCLSGDDDRIFTFFKEGILDLQQYGTVFITDKLKSSMIRPASKFKFNVFLQPNNLLQLDLVNDSLSADELYEILSRYDRKKKFFRLKSGEFIEMDQQLNDFISMNDVLSFSKDDLEEGSVTLPKYRALYLDEFSRYSSFDLDMNDAFRHLIKKMREIDLSAFAPPAHLQSTLRPYQLDGFRWLCALRENGFAGLLADEMGLGKTLQVISFIGSWQDRKRVLIVCPASLVYNWSNEIHRFMPEMHTVMIQGSAEERKDQILNTQDTDIMITSYDLLKRDIEFYENMEFSCEVIDEAQYIKNAKTQASKSVKAIHADFRIALTGTPIENRLSELWSIFDYLLPGFLHSYERFRKTYEMPIMHEDDLSEKELTQMITPFVLRRLKKDVLQDLPDKLEEIYYAPLEAEQKELYQATVQAIKNSISTQTDKEFSQNKMQILAELTKLRQICCNPALYFDKYKGNSTKEDLCVDTIMRAVSEGHKVLIFSQFTSMLDILMKRLAEENIAYHVLTGQTSKQKRAELVDSFQNDDVPVFCISLKAGGTGLNLTAADIVIHYDPWWNTAVENQASDRAHRIGQKNVVSVYKLIMKDTIEERILALQQEKSGLSDRILSGDGISTAKLTREDLLALL